MREIYSKLDKLYSLGELDERRDDLAFVSIPADKLHPLLRHLRDQEGFVHLVLLTAVDWLEEGLFQLTYLLCNREQAIDQFAFGDLQITSFLDPGPFAFDRPLRTGWCSSFVRETVEPVIPMVIIELTEHCRNMPCNGSWWGEFIHEPVHEDLHTIVPTNGNVLNNIPEAIIRQYLHTTGSMRSWQ